MRDAKLQECASFARIERVRLEKQRAVENIRGGAKQRATDGKLTRKKIKNGKQGGGGPAEKSGKKQVKSVPPVVFAHGGPPLDRTWRDDEEANVLQRKPRGIVCVMTHNY
jgi:hypothetical protein